MTDGKVFFNAAEIYEFAVRIEENGEQFYRRVASISEAPKVRELFTLLADEEIKHKKTFQGLLSKIEQYDPPESYPGEYFEYLRAYADNIIFTSLLNKELPDKIAPAVAVDFGIRRELDSITYYLEVKNLVPDTQKAKIDAIIEEERRHFLKLSQLRKTL